MKNYILISSLLALFTSCDNKEKDSQVPSFKNKYTVEEAGLYPEGIDFDTKNEKFLFGSLYKGAIYAMNLKGELSVFAKSSQLVLPTGVYTDEVRNRLIVANADLGVSLNSKENSAGSVASVSIFNLSSGALIKEIDLKNFTPGAGSCPNDIAVDADGNIYVTDSFSPLIYKIDGSYNASVFLSSPIFQAPAGSFGLNGIVYHPDGYLLAAKSDEAKLFKISLSNPAAFTEVKGMSYASPDGLELDKNNNLIIVENGLGEGKTYTFSSADKWASAMKISEKIIGKSEFPTTAALASDGNVYVVSSKLNKLLEGDKSQSSFNIQKID